METQSDYTKRFTSYFDRAVAQKAAEPLSNGVEIEFHVGENETFTFTRAAGKNCVLPNSASNPHFIFTLTPGAADAILADTATDIGTIGVNILRLAVSQDPNKKVSIRLKAGFLKLFSNGYFGLVTAGGAQLTSFLASRGLGGMGAIKAALKKLGE